ncbi:ABC-2 type transport system permease protein [Pseudomonas marginalis]|uniref:ABC transporter permease n=1 Tax=Pseudomonas marginalis TaxID=298 RepID=UPI00209E38C0|nr:ABC transporter permease [Pseudomonas marginalis]MCP1507504.1 ABC-2 type transport system permease protein [Pseudomonas marginalis]MCP1525008.1 ABC-2 type transport system permease protein [Pseudomonas marginalis]MDQ0500397.1 ABC-2 type transport system permease protein [Pseudomonas marginalis]
MKYYPLYKSFLLAGLFIKEQLKEPVALFWIVISPAVTFYLISYARVGGGEVPKGYLDSTSWFYAFVSSSVALFGLAFYIVGRRESGFLRSFVYAWRTKAVFLVGQFFAYSVMSIVYCSAFYVFTRNYFGVMEVAEFLTVLVRFYICFLLFSIPSLLLTLIPIGFQNANTLFSILSFLMLALGIVGMNSSHPLFEVIRFFNPMWWANRIMLIGVAECSLLVIMVFCFFILSFLTTLRFLLINPVWSRY